MPLSCECLISIASILVCICSTMQLWFADPAKVAVGGVASLQNHLRYCFVNFIRPA
jgi:hypothetical protein